MKSCVSCKESINDTALRCPYCNAYNPVVYAEKKEKILFDKNTIILCFFLLGIILLVFITAKINPDNSSDLTRLKAQDSIEEAVRVITKFNDNFENEGSQVAMTAVRYACKNPNGVEFVEKEFGASYPNLNRVC